MIQIVGCRHLFHLECLKQTQEYINIHGKPSKCPVCRGAYTSFDHSSNPTDLDEQKSWDEHFGVQGFYGVFEKDLIEAVLPDDPEPAMNTHHFRDGTGAGAGAPFFLYRPRHGPTPLPSLPILVLVLVQVLMTRLQNRLRNWMARFSKWLMTPVLTVAKTRSSRV